MNKTYVWGIPTRIFHWMFAIAIVAAYILSEDAINWHVTLGMTALLLAFFRIIYGFLGPRYSNFRDFPISISKIKHFLKVERKSPLPSAGHNPLASLIMILILVMMLLVPFSGMLALGQEFDSGLFVGSSLINLTEWKEVHELCVNGLIALVIIHLLGLAADWRAHAQHASWKSMFTGYKTGINEEDVKLNLFQKVYSLVWFLIPFSFFLFSVNNPPVSEAVLQQIEEYEHASGDGEQGEDEHETDDED